MIIKSKIFIVLVFLIIVSIIGTFLLKNYIRILNGEITVIQNEAISILEDIYKTPVVLNLIKNNERNFITNDGLKIIYGNYIFGMSSTELNDNILVYWKKDEDLLKIIKIERQSNHEMLFQR